MIKKHIIRNIRYSLRVITRIFGKGEIDKSCPCCNYHGKFDTIGDPPRYGCLCPACGSFERHRLLVLADKKADFFTNKRVLHFAPEPVLSHIINSCAKQYLSADLTPGHADCVLNIEQIEQPDGSWDVVLCSHILEHVNDQKALIELHRILCNGGLLIAIVPIIESWETTYENPIITSKQDRQWHFGQFDHVRYYGRDFRNRLEKAGFSIREHTANGSDTVKYGLSRGEKVFLCQKKNIV